MKKLTALSTALLVSCFASAQLVIKKPELNTAVSVGKINCNILAAASSSGDGLLEEINSQTYDLHPYKSKSYQRNSDNIGVSEISTQVGVVTVSALKNGNLLIVSEPTHILGLRLEGQSNGSSVAVSARTLDGNLMIVSCERNQK